MIVFPHELAEAARQAGIPLPAEADIDSPDTYRLSHVQFFVLVVTQTARPMTHGEHWENAKALAKIPVDELKLMTATELQSRGVNCGV